MDCGAAAYPINKVMFETKRLPRLRLEAYLIEHVAFFSAGRIGISIIPAHLRQQLGLTSDDLDDISGFARDISALPKRWARGLAVRAARAMPTSIRAVEADWAAAQKAPGRAASETAQTSAPARSPPNPLSHLLSWV